MARREAEAIMARRKKPKKLDKKLTGPQPVTELKKFKKRKRLKKTFGA